MFDIQRARSAGDFEAARALLDEYAQLPGVFACFERYERELAHLGEVYAPPRGALLIARAGGVPAGCVALRDLGDGVCEMKRLYVRPASRGKGLGRALAQAIVGEGRAMGFAAMRLDSLAWMHAAHAIYREMGFRPIAPYTDRGAPDELYMELDLRAAPAPSEGG